MGHLQRGRIIRSLYRRIISFYAELCRKLTKEVITLILDEIMIFKDLPIWVSKRLSLVTRNFGSVDYEFYLQSLTLDPRDCEGNSGIAFFLTPHDFIKVGFTLRFITVEKTKLSDLVKVVKNIGLPIDEVFDDQDIRWQLVKLIFSDNSNIVINPPLIDSADNLKAYQNFISKL